jgi:Fic family protein
LEIIKPFESLSTISNNLIAEMFLYNNNFNLIEYIPYQQIMNLKKYKYDDALNYVSKTEDFTEWIDFYLDCIIQEIQILKDKFLLLEKESKQKEIPKIEKLTNRQQRIYQYLLDYKFIQNSQFKILFPDISEDSILRDLKFLLDQDLIIKSGKTKSSKYELKH